MLLESWSWFARCLEERGLRAMGALMTELRVPLDWRVTGRSESGGREGDLKRNHSMAEAPSRIWDVH